MFYFHSIFLVLMFWNLILNVEGRAGVNWIPKWQLKSVVPMGDVEDASNAGNNLNKVTASQLPPPSTSSLGVRSSTGTTGGLLEKHKYGEGQQKLSPTLYPEFMLPKENEIYLGDTLHTKSTSNKIDTLRDVARIDCNQTNDKSKTLKNLVNNITSDTMLGANTGTELIKSASNKPLEVNSSKTFARNDYDRDLRFSELPTGETYLAPSFNLEKGPFLFEFMSTFFTYVYPLDTAEVMRELIWNNASWPSIILTSIKVESPFLMTLILFICLSVTLPAFYICQMILNLLERSKDVNEEAEPQKDQAVQKKLLLLLLAILSLFSCIFTAGMELSSEHSSWSRQEFSRAFFAACSDVSTWSSAALRDLHYAVLKPSDEVMEAYKEDFKHFEDLLGHPIQKRIATESGLEILLDSLDEISTDSNEFSNRITSIRDVCIRASEMSLSTEERLKDLSQQLENVKKHCTGRDVALCDTIVNRGLELNMDFDKLFSEKKLLQLRSLGEDKLTRAANSAKDIFNSISSSVAERTKHVRDDILKALEARMQILARSFRVLNDMSRHLSATLAIKARKMDSQLATFGHYDNLRWSFMLASSTISAAVILMLLVALCLRCDSANLIARRTLQIFVFAVCFVSIFLWMLTAFVFLVGGHGEVYICSTLNARPHYKVLSQLLDRHLNSGNGSSFNYLFAELNVTTDVSIKDVLNECADNKPAYEVFHLDKVININNETSFGEWSDLNNALSRIATAVNVTSLRSITHELIETLDEMRNVVKVDVSHYRKEFNGPLISKDLTTLSDQLENTANQILDPTAAARVETLALRTRRVQMTNIQPLDALRNELLFRLTALEIQLAPYQRSLNVSYNQIKAMQTFLDNQGAKIANECVKTFQKRMTSHLTHWRSFSLNMVSRRAARCRPLYDAFSTVRSMLCGHYVASLHGFWVCSFLLCLCWLVVAPLSLQLARVHTANQSSANNQMQDIATLNASSVSSTPPGAPPPPQSAAWS